MSTPRQMFTTLLAGTALATAGCAVIAPSAPPIFAGVYQARNTQPGDPRDVLNGWQVDPQSQVTLQPIQGYNVPYLVPNNILIRRPLSGDEANLYRQCQTQRDATFYPQCATVTPPSHLIFQLDKSLVYAKAQCQPAQLNAGQVPGMTASNQFLLTICAVSGDYDVKSNYIPQRTPIIRQGRPTF